MKTLEQKLLETYGPKGTPKRDAFEKRVAREIEVYYAGKELREKFPKEIFVSSFAKRIGMNRSLLAHYLSGTKKPSAKQLARIQEGLNQLGRELMNVNL